MRRALSLILLVSLFSFGERLFYLMGTYFLVEVEEEKVYPLYEYMRALEEKLSDYIETSEVSLINANAGIKPVKVSEETYRVIELALEVARKTGGAYDPTVGSYTINYLRKGLLGKEEALSLIGYRNLQLIPEERKVFLKKKGMALDLGGIGKGYALDLAREFLKTKRGFLALSGDMAVWGHSRVIGIYDPRTGGILLEGKNAKDLCISTSGNYLREHILTEGESPLQVTVVHHSCSYADALATALFSAGREGLRSILKAFPEAGVLVLYRDGSLFMNEKFREAFEYLEVK